MIDLEGSIVYDSAVGAFGLFIYSSLFIYLFVGNYYYLYL